MNYLTNKTFAEIKLGDQAVLQRTLHKKDIELFAIVSGDVNPAHLDPQYAKDDIFHHIVAHGMWTGALISAVLGTQLPGPGTIYLEQTLKFQHPVAINDVITTKVTVCKKYKRKPILMLRCECVNQFDKVVVSGFAKVLTPVAKFKCEQAKLPKIVFQS